MQKTLDSTTKQAAVKEAAGRVAKIDRGEVPTASTVTLAGLSVEFFDSWEGYVDEGQRSARTLALYRSHYRTHIEPKLGKRKVQALVSADIAKLLREVEGSSWTKHGVLTCLASMLEHARTRGTGPIVIGRHYGPPRLRR